MHGANWKPTRRIAHGSFEAWMRFWYQWIQRRKRKRRPDEEEPADAEDDADNREREERETENSDSESEREGTEEDEDDDVLPAAMTGREAAGSVASIKETEQMFTKSVSPNTMVPHCELLQSAALWRATK